MGAPITDLRELNFNKPLDDRLSTLQRQLQRLCDEAVPFWGQAKLLGEGKGQTSSYGATVKLIDEGVDLTLFAGIPDQLFDFTLGSGDGKSRQYMANAVRKAMATARTGEDTSELRQRGDEAFQSVVPSFSDEDGSWPVGEFPWAGAVLITQYGYRLLIAWSGHNQWKDDALSRTLGAFGAAFLKEYDDAAAEAKTSTEEAAPAETMPVPGAVG